MSLVSSQIRYMFLILRSHDLEYKIQLITQTKMGLGNSVSDILNVGAELDPDSPEVKLLEKRRQKLLQIEKKLDCELAMYQTQLKEVDAETKSVQQMLDKNIERAFSYGGGGGR